MTESFLRKSKCLKCFFLLLVSQLLFTFSGQSANSATQLKNIQTIAVILPNDTNSLTLAEKNDLASIRKVLEVSGFRYSQVISNDIHTSKLSSFKLIIVPFASAKTMSNEDRALILDAVKGGSNLFADGVSPLSEQLGIKVQSKAIKVTKIHDTHFSKDTLFWTTPNQVQPIDNSLRADSVLAFEEITRQPIAISATLGKGRFIYISTLFDPNTTKGYSQFPFLIEWMGKNLGLERIAERQTVEMYFDPGMRFDETNYDSLAQIWRERMIMRLYMAGWYYDNNVNYVPIIEACHKNGIQVYCWLEVPEINKTFWDIHPQWREKTATGRDANVDWRKLMNLAQDDCRKQVMYELDSFLMKHDWDGVNFAELYFEPHPQGFDNPDNFTPMNDIVRAECKKKNGFDPIELFDAKSPNYWKTNKKTWRLFADYRKDLSYRLKGQFLAFLNTVKQRKSGFDVMMTGIDVSLKPEESDNIGESTEYTLALYKKYGITLQIEDPSNCWGSGPERYDNLGELYRKTVKNDDQLVFDCNVVGSHEKGFGGFPSELPSGEEIRQITYNMSTHNIRPAFYAEDGVIPLDFKNISSVLARKAIITQANSNEWNIQTPYSIWVNTGLKKGSFTLDGKPWFAANNGKVLIPEGQHTLRYDITQMQMNTISLLSISGTLQNARFSENLLEFSYNEAVTSCYVIIDKKPQTLYVDGKKSDCLLMEGETFVVRLPQGKHIVFINQK